MEVTTSTKSLMTSSISAFTTTNGRNPLTLMSPASSAPVVHLSPKGGSGSGKSGASGIVSLFCVYCNQVFKVNKIHG
jgi:hypothetical protein